MDQLSVALGGTPEGLTDATYRPAMFEYPLIFLCPPAPMRDVSLII